MIESAVNVAQPQDNDKGWQHNGQSCGEGAANAQKLTVSGLLDNGISYVRGAVDAYRARGHLAYGHDISKGLVVNPGVIGDHNPLNKRKHRISATYGEEPYYEKTAE